MINLKINSEKLINNLDMSKHIIKSRTLPNYISSSKDVFQKGGGGHIQFFKEDLVKMAKMTFEECEPYKQQLVEAGKYYETKYSENLEKLPKWIKETIQNI